MKNLKSNVFFWALMMLVLIGAVGGNTLDFLRFRGTTLPSAGKRGELRLDNSSGQIKMWNSTASAWEAIAGDSGVTDLASGDITGVLPIAHGGTNNGSLAVTSGGLVYTDGSKLVNSGAGTFDQVLTSNGSSAPVWSPRPGLNADREYITAGHFENGTTSFSAYADAAASTPADGTGGSPNSTVAITTTAGEVLNGSTSLEFAKGAANRQGEGFSRDFSVDYQDYNNSRCPIIRFNYKATANYPSGALKVFVYDRDAAEVLTVKDAANLDGALVPSLTGTTFTGHFCVKTTTSNDYRLIWHIVGTETTAWDFHIDNVSVATNGSVPGALLTEWQSYTPTGSWTGNTTYVGKYRRVGDTLEAVVTLRFSAGPTPATSLTVNLPSGLTIDTSKLSDASRDNLGEATLHDNSGTSSGHLLGKVLYNNTTSVSIASMGEASGDAGYNELVTPTAPVSWVSGDVISITFKVPIASWYASATLSADQILLRKAKARYTTVAGQSLSSGATPIIDYGTKDYDDLNSVTTGASWKFTAPVAAKYRVAATAVLVSSAAWAATETFQMFLYKNGSLHSVMVYHIAKTTGAQEMAIEGVGEVSLVAGDYIDIRLSQNSGSSIAMYTGVGYNWVTVSAIQDESAWSLYNPYRRVRAKLNCDAASTILSQNGTWISSIGNISGGECSVTMTTGIFSGTPLCVCSRAETAFTVGVILGCNATSATALAIDSEDDAGSAGTGFDVVVDCEGTPGSVAP